MLRPPVGTTSRRVLVTTMGIMMFWLAAGPRACLVPEALGQTAPASRANGNAASVLRYTFEDGDIVWGAEDFDDSRACLKAEQTPERSHGGDHSLKLDMDLVGGHAAKSKGEAFVDMRRDSPVGVETPVDLTGRTITAWVYAPPGAGGRFDRPNGFQLFVKDADWKAEYGPWTNVEQGRWLQVSLPVSRTCPKDGWMQEGFDPTRIIAVGIKMGCGDRSAEEYRGPVYVDDVSW